MQTLANLFSSSSTSRVACSLRLGRGIYLPVTQLRACASTTKLWQNRIYTRFKSTQNFESFVTPADVTKTKMSHGHRATQIVGDAADKQIHNRTDSMSLEARWLDRSTKAGQYVKSNPPADKYAGRTVHVRVEGDLAISFRHLDNILQRNKVRATLRMTERHEKPGVKRRRLSSQRWRKRFADEVRKKVQLVMKIRDRGA